VSWLRLQPPFDQPVFALALQRAFAARSPPLLSLPEALSPQTRRALRRLAAPALEKFDFPDRGRYRIAKLTGGSEMPPPGSASARLRAATAPFLDELRDFAEVVSGARLRDGPAQIVSMGRGDYSLRLDDARARPGPAFVEVALDLSTGPHPFAATVYSQGPFSHLAVAQLPGQLTLARRSPESSRCDRYRSAIVGPRAFVLLRAAFPLAES